MLKLPTDWHHKGDCLDLWEMRSKKYLQSLLIAIGSAKENKTEILDKRTVFTLICVHPKALTMCKYKIFFFLHQN